MYTTLSVHDWRPSLTCRWSKSMTNNFIDLLNAIWKTFLQILACFSPIGQASNLLKLAWGNSSSKATKGQKSILKSLLGLKLRGWFCHFLNCPIVGFGFVLKSKEIFTDLACNCFYLHWSNDPNWLGLWEKHLLLCNISASLYSLIKYVTNTAILSAKVNTATIILQSTCSAHFSKVFKSSINFHF